MGFPLFDKLDWADNFVSNNDFCLKTKFIFFSTKTKLNPVPGIVISFINGVLLSATANKIGEFSCMSFTFIWTSSPFTILITK